MLNKIILDIENEEDVSDELYDLIFLAFCDKAERLGIDPASVLFDDWLIATTGKEYGNA